MLTPLGRLCLQQQSSTRRIERWHIRAPRLQQCHLEGENLRRSLVEDLGAGPEARAAGVDERGWSVRRLPERIQERLRCAGAQYMLWGGRSIYMDGPAGKLARAGARLQQRTLQPEPL